ncbi:unnamed protein product [Adineta ricciae]|uniref:W2 domain-containing protein n=1 Tax=Adineta ricciae TaxID=249248 RepID=A0A814G1K8_ADIRI|nr:unnamed protein product [Adineta ricciae]CAF1084825.1 unnamed protein product [Adineta ricciae]
MLSDSIKQVKNDVMDLHMALTDASKAIVEERTKQEQKCEIWRSKRLATIEREYGHNMRLIKSRQLVLEEVEGELNQRLKVEVQQPLEEMSSKPNVNPELLGVIQSTLDTIKTNSKSFTWKKDHTNTDESATKKPKKVKLDAAAIGSAEKVRKWKPSHKSISLFRDIGPMSEAKINEHFQTQKASENSMKQYGLVVMVNAYLQTWHSIKVEKGKYKELILRRHISTIKKHVVGRECKRKVLVAMQFFFETLTRMTALEKTEMMTMLLEWFLRHQCISLPEVIDWYQKETFVDHMIGRVVHKNWTESFLSQHGYRTEPLGTLTRTNSVTSTNSSEETSELISELPEYVRIRKPYRKLVNLFKDTSNVNDPAIYEYVRKICEKNMTQRVIMVVRSYLKAWNESLPEEKANLLSSKISAILHYQSDRNFQRQILFAIEVFLSECKKNYAWRMQTVSMLFQFFLDQQCIDKESIVKWYEDGHIYNDVYYEQTKTFARSFVERLTALN